MIPSVEKRLAYRELLMPENNLEKRNDQGCKTRMSYILIL